MRKKGMMSFVAFVLILGGFALLIADQNGAFVKLPPPSPEVAALIEEIKTGPNDWETKDFNGYYAQYYSPSRGLLINAKPDLTSAGNDHPIWMTRITNPKGYGAWYEKHQYSGQGTSPVPAPDGLQILNAARPYLKKAKPAILSPIARIVADKDKKDAPSELTADQAYGSEVDYPQEVDSVPEAREAN